MSNRHRRLPHEQYKHAEARYRTVGIVSRGSCTPLSRFRHHQQVIWHRQLGCRAPGRLNLVRAYSILIGPRESCGIRLAPARHGQNRVLLGRGTTANYIRFASASHIYSRWSCCLLERLPSGAKPWTAEPRTNHSNRASFRRNAPLTERRVYEE